MNQTTEAQATEVMRKWRQGLTTTDALIRLITAALTDAYERGKRDEQEAAVQRVALLVGKDSGNWNRAVTYAMDAIRGQDEGERKLEGGTQSASVVATGEAMFRGTVITSLTRDELLEALRVAMRLMEELKANGGRMHG